MYTTVTIERIRCTKISTTFIKRNGYVYKVVHIHGMRCEEV